MAISPAATIHPSAVVEDGAEIGAGTTVGAFCVVGPEVSIGADCTLHSHVVVTGVTRIGDGTRLFPFASIGHEPQDLKFHGERTSIQIGRRNTIREYATISPGTEGGGGVTVIGDGNLLMMHVHVGHDCRLGNGIVLANAASLGGHAVIGDGAVVGALAGIHQFCRIGRGAMIGGLSAVVADVIPYGTVTGERAHLAGLNLVGLKRRGVGKADISDLRGGFAALFSGEGTLQERVARLLDSHPDNALIADIAVFITEGSSRHFTLPE